VAATAIFLHPVSRNENQGAERTVRSAERVPNNRAPLPINTGTVVITCHENIPICHRFDHAFYHTPSRSKLITDY